MVDHAISGGPLEIMGLLFGEVTSDCFIVRDCVALPVEGTETRVNAGDDANEFIVKFIESEEKLQYRYRAVGWYHSHPGYRCWLSAIDVATQRNHQRHQDPWIALVIDPLETLKRSKIDIGAFRTFTSAYVPAAGEPPFGIQFEVEEGTLSREKQQEFGSSSNDYYPLAIQILWPVHVQGLMQHLGSLGHLEHTQDFITVGNAVLNSLKATDHKALMNQIVNSSLWFRAGDSGYEDSFDVVSGVHESLSALQSLLAANPSSVL
eukprot:Gregarina_sp_Poly_1__3426@NODE_1997_length_2897_cov_48_789753_g1261_i2_p2_GENE_NODE_1997_length_2897_cov_48_789753_g1261_i2NODE_1997_length_2897_cov_48_789753_g1261_i2_p2_ORF_typecomplete_len283_score44_08JAB/PF01398_21/9_3e29ProkJAB/PF14464_6/5_3e12UPF0172/PF03665_13/0_0044Cuoxidase_3/PF07732_15/2_6Cuoxidase_3/PF07732_15/1_3e02_NODE_1997_length_2897_cov_48_789753_g1261_i263851